MVGAAMSLILTFIGGFAGGVLGPFVGDFFLKAMGQVIREAREASRQNRAEWERYHLDRNARIDELCRLKREAKIRREHIAP
jgi:hypothetical protein